MNRKLFLLLIFQGCFMISSIAQDSIANKPRHLFGIYSGATDHFIIDESTFPDVDFNGLLVPLYINYRYLGVKTRQTCSFYIDHLVLSSTNSNIANDLNATNTNAILEYSYNRQFL